MIHRGENMFGFRPPAARNSDEDADAIGFRVGQTDDVPGFRVEQPADVVGFNMPTDGRAGEGAPGGFYNLTYSPDPNAQITPVNCTSDGSTFGCTTPRGRSFSGIPAPPQFPARIAPDLENYHATDVQSPPGVSAGRLLQGVIDTPTPGPRYLNHPATPEGTVNEATPGLGYGALIGTTHLPYGSPMNPVKSYLSKDDNGNPIVVNVTEPGHGLEPGYVVHYIADSPEGPRIQTEGEGLSVLQGSHSPEFLRELLSTGTWGPYQRRILDQSK
jgi:hypothetical protein